MLVQEETKEGHGGFAPLPLSGWDEILAVQVSDFRGPSGSTRIRRVLRFPGHCNGLAPGAPLDPRRQLGSICLQF